MIKRYSIIHDKNMNIEMLIILQQLLRWKTMKFNEMDFTKLFTHRKHTLRDLEIIIIFKIKIS